MRLQKLYDDNRRKKEAKFEDYEELFALDYGKAIAAHYHFLSPTLQLDIDRAIEEIDPPTTNVAIHYRTLKSHLANKWGPNSVKDSSEATSKLTLLRVDERGADVYLAAIFSIIDLLTKTPKRDAANNPIMEPVPPRPHLPRPLATATPAEHAAYIAADEDAEQLWALQHPNNKVTNHRPTDDHIKNTVILALAASSFTHYSSLAHKYQQVDHATRTWADLRQDLQTRIQNTALGTSRDPSSLPRRTRTDTTDWATPQRSAYPLHENRYARQELEDGQHRPNYNAPHRDNKRNRDDDRRNQPYPQDVRSASPATTPPNPTNKYPCANCNADHKTIDCDSTKCGLCEADFPTASQRKAHYHTYHRNEQSSKRTRFNLPGNPSRPSTPPTGPFLNRSARSVEGDNASPYDSGYDSTASGPGNPPSSRGNSDVDDQADRMLSRIYDVRVATATTETAPIATRTSAINPQQSPPTDVPNSRATIPTTRSNTPPQPLDSSSYDDLPDLIYSSDDEPSPPWNAAATLTDDQKNRAYRTTITQPSTTLPAPYDIRVATHHDDSAGSASVDSDHTHDPPGEDELDPPDAQYHHSTDDEEPQPPPPERADPTDYQILGWISAAIPWADYRHRLSPTLGKRYGHTLPPNVYRLKPNRDYMLDPSNQINYPFTVQERLLAYARSGLTWSNYLATISPLQRAIYEGIPPMYPDYQPHVQGDPRSTRPTRIALPNRPPTTSPPSPPRDRQNHTSTRGYVATYPPNKPSKRQRPASPESTSTPSAQNTSRLTNEPALKDPAEPHPDSLHNQPVATSSNSVHQPTTTHHTRQDVRSEGYQRQDHNVHHTGTSPPQRTPHGPQHLSRRQTNRVYRTLTLSAQTRYDIGTRLPEDHWHYNIGPDGPRFTDGGSMNHYQHTRQFNLRTPRHSRAPHTQGPPPPDAEGEPWCECCTAYLSEDDNTQQGLRDPDDRSIRYRCRQEEDPPPTHSNLHLGYLRIFRSNELYQNDQRSHQYKTLARTGNHATQQPTSTYANTEEMADLQNSLANLQFQRYRGRGGRFSQAQHTMRSRDHRYNSPNHHNMAIGQSYRKWFKKTISRRHYSLGEATEYYNRWLEDPNHFPNGPHPEIGSRAPLTHDDFRSDALREQYFLVPPASPPTPPPQQSDSDKEYDTDPPYNNFAQAYEEVITAEPDDTTGILDSGAMMTTATRRHLSSHHHWIENIRPAAPGTSIRYGNMETEPVEEQGYIGSYQLSVVPDRFRTALICVHDIVAAGHSVTFNQHNTIISDNGAAYTLRIHRDPTSREWRVPLTVLERLTELRSMHPIRQLQPTQTGMNPN